jgi:hypothetical protein
MGTQGINETEVHAVLAESADEPAKLGRRAKTKVFSGGFVWRGGRYPHKEVKVIYK